MTSTSAAARYRVLVVDDEQPVIDGISTIIERDAPGFRIVGTAASGRQAMEQLREHSPDVLLLDIHMPGLDGLDVLREMKDAGIGPVTFLVSAYERFDIAREAFGLGVFDYVLKPLSPRRLKECLDRAAIELERRHSQQERMARISEREDRAVALLEGVLVDELVHLPVAPDRRADLLAELDLAAGAIAGLLIHDRGRVASALDRIRFSLRICAGRPDEDSVRFLVPCSADAEAQRFSQLEQLVERVGEDGAVLLLSPHVMPADFGAAFAALEQRGRSSGGQGPDGWRGALSRSRDAVIAAIDLGDASANEKCDAYLNHALRLGVFWPAVSSLCAKLPQLADPLSLVPDTADPSPAGGAALPPDKQRAGLPQAFARRIVDTVAHLVSEDNADAPYSRVVRDARRIVRTRFAQGLSLEGVAEELRVTAPHLSRMFSRETGETFVDYLSEVRINHACHLLDAGQLSVKEVARECGYADANYFSRAFKRLRACTPSEYAARARRPGPGTEPEADS